MPRPDRAVTKFDGQAGKHAQNSIYKRESVPDSQDNMKVQDIANKFCRPKIKAPVDYLKQLGRDVGRKPQVLKNIETENAR